MNKSCCGAVMRNLLISLMCLVLLASCGAVGNSSGSLGGSGNSSAGSSAGGSSGGGGGGNENSGRNTRTGQPADDGGKIWDLFQSDDSNVNVKVSKYLWSASLETLNFLPVESADPFTGVIVMGWGTAPGSSRQYKATVFIKDPALEARSLTVSLVQRAGGGSTPASAETVRQIEDAILTRARQLRVADSKL